LKNAPPTDRDQSHSDASDRGSRARQTIDPTEAARSARRAAPDGWGPLMQPIRRVAVELAEQGRVVILRKGKAVDPRDFKGVYRLGRAEG